MTTDTIHDRVRLEQATEALAALQGIALYARQARRHLDRPDADVRLTAVEVLDAIDGHCTAVLDGNPGASRIPVAQLAAVHIPVPPAPRVAAAGGPRLDTERCIDLLIDPKGSVGRMPIVRLLALAPGVGEDAAREITDRRRMAAGRSISSIPLPERLQIAADLRERQGARA